VSRRLERALPAAAALVLFGGALEVLRRELHAITWPALVGDVIDTPLPQLAWALVLTALNYAVLACYDLVAFANVGRKLKTARVALASSLAYAVANSVGFAVLSGASVRYRLYARWGVTGEELARVVLTNSVTFWLGLLVLGGTSLLLGPLPAAHGVPGYRYMAAAGALMILLAAAYLAAVVAGRGPLRLARFELPLPSPRLAGLQLAISVLDWTLVAAVLYVLLPPGGPSFAALLAAFLAAQVLALVSHVPGGVGVFEGLMLVLLGPYVSPGRLLPALLVYRFIYYLLPLALALAALVADELWRHRARTARLGTVLGQLADLLTPRVLAVFGFLAGLGLLLSGATPAAPGRLEWLDAFLPLGVIEASHFLASIAGILLLLVSQGLSRRLDAAYYLAAIGILLGIGGSLLKGADVEEASLLVVLLLLLWRARPAFDRKAALLETRFSASWVAAVLASLLSAAWLYRFAFKHVEYSSEMWWQFELQAEAPRSLRAAVGAALALLVFATARLLAHAPREQPPTGDAELEAAATAIAAQPSTLPFLVYLRDKSLLFDAERRAFVMYAVQARTWVAMGDPVGPPERASGVVRLFLERCDDFGGTPVFYQVGKDGLHRYADFGLAFLKLGEEALVDLAKFDLQGEAAHRLRKNARRVEKQGAGFRVLEADAVAAAIEPLRAVSDAWLGGRAAAEKGFSLGFFEPSYLGRFPVAVLERDARIVAFASLWPGPGHVELSVDLMRYSAAAPEGAMEALLVRVMDWGKTQGYRWFNLGMAPLSGFERSPVAPLWNRLGAFLYRHGEAIYNFQGLRAYKEKFDPVWEPRYLAYPGGLHLPRILADVSALIAGGYRQIFLP